MLTGNSITPPSNSIRYPFTQLTTYNSPQSSLHAQSGQYVKVIDHSKYSTYYKNYCSMHFIEDICAIDSIYLWYSAFPIQTFGIIDIEQYGYIVCACIMLVGITMYR